MPSIYDQVAQELMTRYDAKAVVVIIADGSLGSGMAAVCDDRVIARLPKLLRDAANVAEKNPRGIS